MLGNCFFIREKTVLAVKTRDGVLQAGVRKCLNAHVATYHFPQCRM